jgi:uncharacterized protein (TIGR02996 family)
VADAQALLDAIVDAPDDDAVRLVFSDWLDEHGDADRAEFIRAQIELFRDAAEARRDHLRRRERELLLAHELEWVGPLRPVVRRAAFVRGFVERVTVHAQRLKDAAALFSSAPLRHLILLGGTLGDVAALPQLRRITTLDLREGCTLSAKGVRQFAGSAHLAGVTHLILRQFRLEEGIAKALARTAGLSRLRTLDLYGWWNADPVAALTRSTHLAGLTTLILGGSDDLGDAAAAAFADAGCRLSNLRRLHLANGLIGDEGARALARSPHLAGLEHLDFAGNPITRAGRRALVARFGERVRL